MNTPLATGACQRVELEGEAVEALSARDSGLRSLTEAIDTTGGGRLVFHVFGALTEFERGVIREWTRAELDAARARGRVGAGHSRCRRTTSPSFIGTRAEYDRVDPMTVEMF